MQFIGDYSIDPGICDRLVDLHRACDRQNLVKRGRIGYAGKVITDTSMKDSYDVVVANIPPPLQHEFGLPQYFQELQLCLDRYVEQHPILLKQAANFKLTESPALQHYRPGGGFKLEHFERAQLSVCSRMLVWMTYLNDVTDEGGTRFVYQQTTFDARKGRTLIWPTDFTHTHVGVVSESQHKYIITGWFNYVA